MKRLIERLGNFLAILGLPRGLGLKLGQKAFNLQDFQLCQRLHRAGLKPATIIDVGANIGQFALSATTFFPEAIIHSYEPVPAAFQELEKLSQHHQAIHPIQCALGASPGTAQLHITSQTQSSSLLPLHTNHRKAYPQVREENQTGVTVRLLSEELERLKPRPPVLLKLDVQGYESEVLRGAGATLPGVEWIILETCTRPMYENEVLFEELCLLLKEKGFHFLTPMDIHFTPTGQPAQFDALFVKTLKG